jgi:hypothetical protein
MEQFLAAQIQLLTNMANTIANMQTQMNQAPPPPPPLARDRHREFMSHKPPSFSHSPDPLQADDWIKMVEKMLNIVSVLTGRRSFMLQADWKEPPQIGGMLTSQPMTPPTPSPGRSSGTNSRCNTYPKV